LEQTIKIAITDACIFIDLYDLELIAPFFKLNFEIHTTTAVFYELYEEQQRVLLAYQNVEKLIVHNLVEEDFIHIQNEVYPRSLSEADKSVLYIANKLNACVLSSDKTVRNYAKNQSITYHGMIWIFDLLIESHILTKKEAVLKLQELVTVNFVFQNNRRLVGEIQKRLRLWSE